jgi:hypothetical protein
MGEGSHALSKLVIFFGVRVVWTREETEGILLLS